MKTKEDRSSLLMACGALLVSVITLTIAYAVLSTTLTIKGSAKINSATWNINITAGEDFTTYGNAKFGYPTIKSTTISDMKVDLYQPGDGVKFPFTVRNDGSLDGKLKEVKKGTISCSSTNNYNAQKVCENITYTIKYEDGSEILEGDVINSGGVQFFVLEIMYNKKNDFITSTEVSIDGIDVVLLYEQK